MRSSIPIEPGARLRRRVARRTEPAAASPVSAADRILSHQALRLHALAVEASRRTASGGLISRIEADRLAEESGALTGELVQAGFWLENDLNYVITARWMETTVRRPLDATTARGALPDDRPSSQ